VEGWFKGDEVPLDDDGYDIFHIILEDYIIYFFEDVL
jgi:hypothetical protein